MSDYSKMWRALRDRDPDYKRKRLAARRLREAPHLHSHAVTVTLANRATGALRTVCGDHPRNTHAALRGIAERYPATEWRAVSVSTCATILADVRRDGRKSRRSPEAALLIPAGLGAYLAD